MHDKFDRQQESVSEFAEGIQRWSGVGTFVALDCPYDCLPACTYEELSEEYQEEVMDGAEIDALVYCQYTGTVLAVIAIRSVTLTGRRNVQLGLIRSFISDLEIPWLELTSASLSAPEIEKALASQLVFPPNRSLAGEVESLRCPDCYAPFQIRLEKRQFFCKISRGFERATCKGSGKHPTNVSEEEALELLDVRLSALWDSD
ncbi:MAG: hypothetical protein AAF351_12710 [Pseudomonadota bacterium]